MRINRREGSNHTACALRFPPGACVGLGILEYGGVLSRILVLFPNAWDRERFAHPKYEPEHEVVYHGDDLFKFPGTLKLVTFDAVGFIEDAVQRFGRAGIDGVLSSDEYIGAIIAAEVARRFGLPANDPARIIHAQHKFHARQAMARAAPEANPGFCLIPIAGLSRDQVALEFPFFVKPVKGTFSVFAAKVDSYAALEKHLGFNVLERLLLKRVTRPYNELLRALSHLEHDANNFIGEQLIEGDQVTADGFCSGGDVQIMG